MEKFGIFDLLDALSAMSAPAAPQGDAQAPAPESETASGPAPESETASGPAPEIKPDARDAAFAAPAYSAPAVANMQRQAKDTPPSPENAERPPETGPENAYSSFLSRHEQAVKRIEKKK